MRDTTPSSCFLELNHDDLASLSGPALRKLRVQVVPDEKTWAALKKLLDDSTGLEHIELGWAFNDYQPGDTALAERISRIITESKCAPSLRLLDLHRNSSRDLDLNRTIEIYRQCPRMSVYPLPKPALAPDAVLAGLMAPRVVHNPQTIHQLAEVLSREENKVNDLDCSCRLTCPICFFCRTP